MLAGFAEQIIGQNPPYQQNFTISNTNLSNPASGTTAPPSAAASTIRAIDPEWHTPYMQHWSLEVQHQLGNSTFFSVGYFGSKGTHLIGIEDLKRGLGGLATIGSVAPFVGLFGTTIGIINAFQGMKTEETAGIAAVAGGIAEALVTTAFGLFVAVPAVMAFNAFTNRIETFTVEMDNSASELIDYFLKKRGQISG